MSDAEAEQRTIMALEQVQIPHASSRSAITRTSCPADSGSG